MSFVYILEKREGTWSTRASFLYPGHNREGLFWPVFYWYGTVSGKFRMCCTYALCKLSGHTIIQYMSTICLFTCTVLSYGWSYANVDNSN